MPLFPNLGSIWPTPRPISAKMRLQSVSSSVSPARNMAKSQANVPLPRDSESIAAMKSNFETIQSRSIGRKFPAHKPVVLSAVTRLTLAGSTRSVIEFLLASNPKSRTLKTCLTAQTQNLPRQPRTLPQLPWVGSVALSAVVLVQRRLLPNNVRQSQKKPRKPVGQRNPGKPDLSCLGLIRPPFSSHQSTYRRTFVLTHA